MSLKIAEEDGIEIIPGKRGYIYKVPCEICGRRVTRTQYSRKRTYICDYCKGVINKKKKAEIPESTSETKNETRFRKAVENIKKATKNKFSQYEKAIAAASTRMYKYGSIPEAMVAIELLKNKYRIIPQQRLGKCRVDFVLPDEKIVLEVDGKTYHHDIEKERERDYELYKHLGLGWLVIHIPAEYISENITKLVPKIKEYVSKSTY